MGANFPIETLGPHSKSSSLVAAGILTLSLFAFSAAGDAVVSNCTDADLRAALNSGGTVTFACDGVITLTNTIVISANVALDGSGHSITIDGNNSVRLFTVNSGVSLVLRHLILANGSAQGATAVTAGTPGGAGEGGAIYSHGGNLTAEECKFLRNTALGGTGGPSGVPFSPGAGGIARGGAIFIWDGEVTATDCVFAENRALGGTAGTGFGFGQGGDASGGAVFTLRGPVVMVSCTASNNTAISGQGRRFGTPSSSGLAWGGALYNAGGQVALRNVRMSDNFCQAEIFSAGNGGAICQSSGRLALADCLVSSNRARGGGPTAGNGSGGTVGGGPALGGAILISSGAARLTNSTLAGNVAEGGEGGSAYGGGIFNSGDLQAINCTIAGNNALGGRGILDRNGSAYGGAIYNSSNSWFTHVTIASNSVHRGLITYIGTNFAQGAGIFTTTGGIRLQNSILAYSLIGSNYFGLAPMDDGNNMSSDSSCPLTASGSRGNTDPVLAPLDDYGGPTPTMALLGGSPAIDAAKNDFCTATDQRGVARAYGAACDIGAFESAPPYTIHGRIFGYLSPAAMTVAAESSSAAVDGIGKYNLSGLTPRSHLLRPQATDAIFIPSNYLATVNADVLNVNFTSYRSNAFILERLNSQSCRGIFAGVPGQTWRILESTNPPAWVPFSTNTVESSGLFYFDVTTSTDKLLHLFQGQQPD